MTALGTPIELSSRLIDAPGLHHPPESLIVITFRANSLSPRHSTELPLLLPDNDDLILLIVFPRNRSNLFHRLLNPAFWAHIAPFSDILLAERTALGTELHGKTPTSPPIPTK